MKPNIKKYLLYFIAFTATVVGAYSVLWSRVYTVQWDRKFYVSERTLRYQVVADLNGPWESSKNELFSVPFCSDEHSSLSLKKDFFLHFKPHDTLFLYFEGISWSAEIYLNEKLLTITNHPFKEHLIALNPELLNSQWNKLQVTLHKKGPSYAFYPKRMIGIHKPAFVLQKAELVQPNFKYPRIKFRDSTLIYAPISTELGYNVDVEQFRKDMREISRSGSYAVFFPFRLSNQLAQVVIEEGIEISPKLGKFVALYRDYSMERPDRSIPIVQNTKPLVVKFIKQSYDKGYSDPNFFKLTLVIISLIPLILLTSWKIIDERTYRAFIQLVPRARREFDALHENIVVGGGGGIFALIVRQIFYTSLCFGVLEYLNWSKSLDILNVFSLESASFDFYSKWGQYKATLLLIIFLWISLINTSKFIILQLSGLIFNIKDLAIRVVNIENISNFPTLIYLSLMICCIQVVPPELRIWFLALSLPIAVLHITRKAYLLFDGLNSTLRFPIFVNIMYICAFEILPWLFVL